MIRPIALAPEAGLSQATAVRLDSRYRLLNLLSSDRRGQVWGAVDERLDRRVAVHLLNSGYLSDGRFRAHARTLARLAHPTLVRLYDANADAELDDGKLGTQRRRPIMVTELTDGPTLAQRLETAPLGLPLVTSMASGLASVLGYLHENGLTGNVITANTITICATSAFADHAGQVKSDGTPVAKFSIDCVAPSVTSMPTGPATMAEDVHAFGRVLSEVLGHEGQHPGWTELVSDMLDVNPARRPTSQELCRRIARLDVEPDEIIPWDQDEPAHDSRPIGPRHRAKVRSHRGR